MQSLHAIRAGLLRAGAAPKLIALLWLLNALAALPLTVLMANAIESDLGASRFHEGLRSGLDMEWLAEFDHRAHGVATMFSATRTGAGVVYENLDAWLSGALFPGPGLMVMAVLYGLLWIFLQGALLDRLAHPGERYSMARFARGGGQYFGRLLQLVAFGLIIYYGAYRLATWTFDGLDETFRDTGTETALMIRALVLGTVFIALLHAIRLVLDFAKVALVVDDLRWSPVALGRGLRFVAARPGRTIAVYVALGLLSVVLLAGYRHLAPGAGQATWWPIVFTFLASQLFVAARLFLRVALWSAEMTVYQEAGGL